MDDYLSFCKKLFAATGIPVILYDSGHVAYSSLADLLGISPKDEWTIYPQDKNPEFTAIDPNIEYGHIKVENTPYDIFLGPVFTVPLSEQLMHDYFVDSKTPLEQREAMAEQLYRVPIRSHSQLVRYLLFLHLCLNHQVMDEDTFYQEAEHETASRSAKALTADIEEKENEKTRSAYAFETELFRLIRQGDKNKLKAYLEKTVNLPSEGKTASSPLRHAKNTLISLAARVGVMAAIPGGMDPDQVYRLSDLYMAECEQMYTIEEIKRLEYLMLMDFCERVDKARLPEGISSEIFQSIRYIRNHTNAPISVEEVAAFIHRSSSYLMRRFREETGTSVGSYITRTKLEEACDLLTYDDRSLAEISAYLGYSSQSYFQNVFKKEYQITPMQYRKLHRRQH